MIRLDYINDEGERVSLGIHGAMVTGFSSINGVLYIAFKSTDAKKNGKFSEWSWQRQTKDISNYMAIMDYLTSLITNGTMGLLTPELLKETKNKPNTDQQTLF